MGARYLKAEEAAIQAHYPTAARAEIMELIPNRTWTQIMRKARKMGVYRTTEAKGNSIREGRMTLKNAYLPSRNFLFDRMYPTATYAELLKAFPNRTLMAIKSHAQRRHMHRTKEAGARQMEIGRREARCKKKNDYKM